MNLRPAQAAATGQTEPQGTPAWTAQLRVALMGGLLAAAGGAGFVAALPPSRLVAPVGTAAAAGAFAAAVRRRDGSEAMPLLAFAVLVLLGAMAALGEAPTVLAEAWGTDGWPALRDSPSPAPATPQTLAVPYLLTAAAAYLATVVALRSGWGALSWTPGLVVMVLGYVLGDEWRASSLWVPLLWAALALLSARWQARPGGRSPSAVPDLATGVASVVLVALVTGVAIPLGELLPTGSDRWVLPRASLPAPAESDHPLVAAVRMRNGSDDVLFTAETSAPVPRWRLTVLDDYDGQRWTSSQRFRPVAAQLPASSDNAPGGGTEVTQHIELNVPEGADEMAWGRWLPAADQVLATSLDGLLFDTASSVLLAPEGELPEQYEATSTVGAPEDGPRTEARAATDDDARTASHLPGNEALQEESEALLDDLVTLSEEITAGAASDYSRAVDLQRYLLGNGELLVDESAPSGHSLSHIHDFLLTEDGDGEDLYREDLVGTAEQFATAFALLARATGLPAQVVVGFEGTGTSGRHEVTGHDATAWVEVRFDELGWVAFDAIPDPTSDVLPPDLPSPSRQEDDPGDEEPADSEEDDTDELTEQDEASDDSDDTERTDSWSPPSWAIPSPAMVALSCAFLGLALVCGPGARRILRRRRRRRLTSPSARIAGAWATVLDDVRAAGLTVRHTMSVTDVANLAMWRVPAQADQLAELGTLANQSTFARRSPTDADAARAWELSAAIVMARRSTRSPRQRLREYFTW